MAEHEIVLAGVRHFPTELEETKKLVSKHAKGNKTIALEGIYHPRDELINEFVSSGSKGDLEMLDQFLEHAPSSTFWNEVAVHAAKRGLKVVSIDSTHAVSSSSAMLRRAEKISKTLALVLERMKAPKIKKSRLKFFKKYSARLRREIAKMQRGTEIIAGPLRDEFMVRQIRRKKPDLVFVGQGHTYAIAKAIPVRERFAILGPRNVRHELYRTRARMALRRAQLRVHRFTRFARRIRRGKKA